MTSQTAQQIIRMGIFPDISRSEGSHTMKFGQLIEYNMRNIFLEKSYTECDEWANPRPFIKKSKLSISIIVYEAI